MNVPKDAPFAVVEFAPRYQGDDRPWQVVSGGEPGGRYASKSAASRYANRANKAIAEGYQ